MSDDGGRLGARQDQSPVAAARVVDKPRALGQAASVSHAKCAQCGRPTDEHDRHLRFVLPEPVLSIPEHDRAANTWGNDVLMSVRDVGSFVRVLVPVHLSGGYTVTFGAWLGVHPDDLRRTYEVWNSAEYAQLELDGVLANMLPPWEDQTYGRPLRVRVRDSDEVPYATSSTDEVLQGILTEEWPHEFVLAAVAPFE